MNCYYPGVAGKIECDRGGIFETARKARDAIQILLLPGVQQNPLHPFGGVNTR